MLSLFERRNSQNLNYRTRAIISRSLNFFTPIFTVVIPKKEIPKFLGLKSSVYNREQVIMEGVLYVLH